MDGQRLEQFFSEHWTATVQDCQSSLEPDDLNQARQLKTWEDVLVQVIDSTHETGGFSVPQELALIKPNLSHFDEFTRVFESSLGSILDATFFWGLLGLVLRLSCDDSEALRRIPRMLKHISFKVEEFNGYCLVSSEITVPMKRACFEIQTLLIKFLKTAVKALRGEDEESWQENETYNPWLRFERGYTTTDQELIQTLTHIEKLSRVYPPNKARALQKSFTSSNAIEQKPRYMLPQPAKTPRFFDRTDVFDRIDQVLEPAAKSIPFRSIALFGLGGIGKSAIAARYAETKVAENAFDAIFWIHGEKAASLRQSFTDIAMRLRLPGAQPQSHDENLILVQDWFQTSDCSWLAIYDNVESSDVIRPYWPGASHGKAIITTRNHSLAFEPASSGFEIFSWDAQTGSEFLLFLLKKNIGNDIEAEGQSAYELSKRLSGHALGISHMAGLIHRRSFSIEEFMRIYLKNPRRAHRSELQALWDFSFTNLEPDSSKVLGITSYLMPDDIPQSLFEFEADSKLPQGLEFCSDDFGLSDAVEPLLTLALLKRNRDTRVFTTHRMVQTQFRYFLSQEKRQMAFDNAVAIVYDKFPKQSDQKIQLYDLWSKCNKLLQHVFSLKDCFKEERKMSSDFKATLTFCELLKECQRYLCESNLLLDLEDLCETNLIAAESLDDTDQSSNLVASILSHQAIMYESIGKVDMALRLNHRGYELRLQEVPLQHGLLAGFESNLGYSYNTANEHQTALTWFVKARERWQTWMSSQGKETKWPTHMKTNMARCLVYLNNYVEARKLLTLSITEFVNTKPLNWAMLAFAYFVHGILDKQEGRLEAAEASFIEAQNFWLEGDQTRLHPFNGGCLYKMGTVCLDQGKVEAAVKHLRESVGVTATDKSVMPVEYARSLFKLSEALVQDSYHGEDESEAMREKAERYLRMRDPSISEFGTEDAYDRYIPIFWR